MSEITQFVSQKKNAQYNPEILAEFVQCDLTEMNKCPLMYYRKRGKWQEFCLSNIKNSEKKEQPVMKISGAEAVAFV